MRLPLVLSTAAVAVLATAPTLAVAKRGHESGHHHGKGGKISIVEHADTDATTDTGASGDSAGDVLTFGNPVYDAADSKQVGTDQGYCIRVVKGSSYECSWTNMLAGGNISVEGPFYDTKDSDLVVTGGTGIYKKVRGTMHLHALDGGKKYSFVFDISR